jgi:hypothetical protein
MIGRGADEASGLPDGLADLDIIDRMIITFVGGSLLFVLLLVWEALNDVSLLEIVVPIVQITVVVLACYIAGRIAFYCYYELPTSIQEWKE